MCTEIGKESGCTSGKWMVFRDSTEVDEAWNIIAKATCEGMLGPSSKVSTQSASCNSTGKDHVICVYTANFFDEEDVMRVEQTLRRLGVTGKLIYKPDIYTHLNIYSGNPHGISPTLYTTDGEKSPPAAGSAQDCPQEMDWS